MKFKISIEESIVQEFEIEAESAEEAMNKARQQYHDGLIVLENAEVQSRQMAITKPESEVTEWDEF